MRLKRGCDQLQEVKMIDGVDFSISYEGKVKTLKSLHKDKNGFYITLEYSNDEDKKKQVEECLIDFFARNW